MEIIKSLMLMHPNSQVDRVCIII